MPTSTYDPRNVAVSVGGTPLSGFGDDTFVRITMAEDRTTLFVGSDGHTARAYNANESGQVEFTLRHDSPSNDFLRGLLAMDKLSGTGVRTITVKDPFSRELISAPEAWVLKEPDFERGKEVGTTTWTFQCSKIVRQGL